MVSVCVDKMSVCVDKNWAMHGRFFQSLPFPVELVCSRWQNKIDEVITSTHGTYSAWELSGQLNRYGVLCRRGGGRVSWGWNFFMLLFPSCSQSVLICFQLCSPSSQCSWGISWFGNFDLLLLLLAAAAQVLNVLEEFLDLGLHSGQRSRAPTSSFWRHKTSKSHI